LGNSQLELLNLVQDCKIIRCKKHSKAASADFYFLKCTTFGHFKEGSAAELWTNHTSTAGSIWAASSWPLLLASYAALKIDFPLPMTFRESPSEVPLETDQGSNHTRMNGWIVIENNWHFKA
jgi:hypothetical protein